MADVAFSFAALKISLVSMDTPPLDIAGLRFDYSAQGLRRADLDPDPIRQFTVWFTDAANAGIRDANAMSLATATAEGAPSVASCCSKVSTAGICFFLRLFQRQEETTPGESTCGLSLYWMPLERQVRIAGPTERILRGKSPSAIFIHVPKRAS